MRLSKILREKREKNMKLDELYNIATDAVRDEELRAKDIPNIDLYIDQILNLVSEKNKEGSERYHDRQLTKTMINNYSKDGIITPVNGKKYNREQIAQILSVYTLKNTLSIGEIKRLLDGAYSIEGYTGEDLIYTYDRYIEIKNSNKEYSREILEALMERNGLDIENERDFMLIVGSMVSMSALLRNMAQAVIDVKYPEAETAHEKPKKEKKKKKNTEAAERDDREKN